MRKSEEIVIMSRRELARVLEGGYPIDPLELDDTEYRGISLGLPEIVERLTWKKFKKVFHRDRESGLLRGWNVRVEQNGLSQPWIDQMTNGEPRTFGHYRVVANISSYRLPMTCPNGLLIDYGLGRNGSLSTLRMLRDPIVAVNRGSCELLLGCTYLDLGVASLATPSFFLLERHIPLSYEVDPPG